MSLVEPEVRLKTVAPGQYLGYSLQQVRLCYHLLRAPDAQTVSLEYLDDVAVHRPDGTVLLEQSKSALTGNPISDRSEELWKTFANWADLVADGTVDAITDDFSLYVTPYKNGKLVLAMHEAVSDEAVLSVLAKVKSLIKTEGASSGCDPHILRFLKAGTEICSRIIGRFQLMTEADPIEGIRVYLRATLPPEVLDNFCAVAIGLAADWINKRIREGGIPIISASEFRKHFRAFVRKHNLSDLLLSKAPSPSTDDIVSMVDKAPLFIRQLHAVSATQDMLVTAVSDFLRATADKVHWADEGQIVTDSLDELDAQLERNHKIVRDEIEDTHTTQDELWRGRALYRKCATTVLPLDGRVLPPHFIAGAYNCLADIPRLGWHPSYVKIFVADSE
jgi:hypothetical protein